MSAQEMSFWDHLEELRWTLFRIVIVLFIFAIGGFVIMPQFFDNIIMAPAKADFFLYQWMCRLSRSMPGLPDFCDDHFSINMINIDLTAPFFRHLSTSFWLALILICPYILFEIWRFVSPALYKHEKNNVRWVFLFGSLMFFAGCLVGYGLIFPMTLRFLYSYTLSDVIRNTVSLDSYMDNFLILVFVMGLIFEMPLISWLLSQIGILKKSFFKTYRRHAVVALLMLAAVITPTGDPFTLSLVFIPLYALYELSILLVKADPKEEEEVSLDKI
ncbi:MAG: twin-arginine translocase subunit TatC [Dysgonamonadaceae bacterium]|jgi:sec-independent protein translocase protein TatC|nr:twin-arginine translocase subunit TatC [Dysgonamonadaceae bacterium]